MNYDAIPVELRVLPRWIVWRSGDVDPKTGKRKKPPYPAHAPEGPRHASNQKPEDWATFEQAVAVVEAGRADGIGFALEPPWVGVDLDEELLPAEQELIFLALDSYTERSPSGRGHHVVVRASLNGHGRHPQGIGVFTRDRFFYFTGDHLPETPQTIEERQAELDAVLAEYLPKQEAKVVTAVTTSSAVSLDDRELLEAAFEAVGDKYRPLWEGSWEGSYSSRSEADLALCSFLAWVTGGDASRIDRMFRSSALYRAKWEREDYRERTIDTALGLSRGSDAVDSLGASRGVGTGNGVGESDLRDSPTPDQPTPSVSGGEEAGLRPDADADSVADSDRPFALSLRQFIELERERRKPMLADAEGRAVIGFRSLVLLGALGGHGKTTFALDLLLHMAAGVDYAPWIVPQAVSILVVENEGPEELFAEKLAARLEHFPHELKARFDVCTVDWGGFSLADSKHRQRLVREIAEKRYDLVFGDPLDSLGIEGVGSPEDTRRFLALMKQTGLNKSVAWWLNTHPRKEETREALNEIAGAWGGKPDTVFLLRMLEDDRTQIRQPKLRWARRGKGPKLLFAFDPDTEAFAYIGEQSDEERDYLAEIRELLIDGTWRTVREIAAPTEGGGIAANDKVVKKVLEQHPDVFESCTGDEAKALGRSPQAVLWRRRTDGVG